jgi:hypothetical protein
MHAMRPKPPILAEWLNNDSVPIGRRRRLMQLVLGNFLCGAWVRNKFDQQNKTTEERSLQPMQEGFTRGNGSKLLSAEDSPGDGDANFQCRV